MLDHTFECDGVPFGLGQPIAVEQAGFQPGAAAALDKTTTWVFEGFIDRETDVEALSSLAQLRQVWTRKRPTKENVALRYALAGRTRRVYGKPTRWDHAIDNRILGGGGGVSFEFATADHLHYDDVEQSRVLPIVAASIGGFEAPFIAPWQSAFQSFSDRMVARVGGDRAAPFVAAFTGPIAGAYLQGGDWRIELDTTLAHGDVLEVDTRPWSYGVRLNGAPGGGLLAGTTTGLSRARLNQNGETISFGGTDLTGTATATITWRSAWSSV